VGRREMPAWPSVPAWRLSRADTEQTVRSEQRIAMNTRIIV